MTEVGSPPVAIPQPGQEGTAEEHLNGTATSKTTTNSNTSAKKAKEEKSPKKSKESPKHSPAPNVEEDPIGWVKWHQKSKKAMAILRYHSAKWTQLTAVADESKHRQLPKSGAMSDKEFIDWHRDGSILAHLANKLSAGSVETVYEGDAAKQKDSQMANWNGFINFLKDKACFGEEKLVSAEEMLAGKGDQLFYTIYELSLSAQEKFNVASFDVEKVSKELLQHTENGFKNAIAAGVQFVQKKLALIHLPGRGSASPINSGEQNGTATVSTEGMINGADTAIGEVKTP